MIDFRRGLTYYLATLFEPVAVGVIEITDISYDTGNGEVTITFRSEPGKSYAVAKATVNKRSVKTHASQGGEGHPSPPRARKPSAPSRFAPASLSLKPASLLSAKSNGAPGRMENWDGRRRGSLS